MSTECGELLPAPPPAAAAVQGGRRVRQQLRVGVVAQRVAAPRGRAGGPGAGGGAGGPGGGRAARAHAVRLPGRERGGAVVRAQPDHHQRVAVGGAGLAARHPQRQERPRAAELRGAPPLAPT